MAERRAALRDSDAGPSSRGGGSRPEARGRGAPDKEGTLTAAATAPPARRLPGPVRGHTGTRRPLPGPASRPSCCCRRCRHAPAPAAAPASPPRPYGAAAAPEDELIGPRPPRLCRGLRRRRCGQPSVTRLLSAELASPPQLEADMVGDKLPTGRQCPCGQEGQGYAGGHREEC